MPQVTDLPSVIPRLGCPLIRRGGSGNPGLTYAPDPPGLVSGGVENDEVLFFGTFDYHLFEISDRRNRDSLQLY